MSLSYCASWTLVTQNNYNLYTEASIPSKNWRKRNFRLHAWHLPLSISLSPSPPSDSLPLEERRVKKIYVRKECTVRYRRTVWRKAQTKSIVMHFTIKTPHPGKRIVIIIGPESKCFRNTLKRKVWNCLTHFHSRLPLSTKGKTGQSICMPLIPIPVLEFNNILSFLQRSIILLLAGVADFVADFLTSPVR